ncbi:MAG: hypothetical protein IJU03_04000 [Thermoguttaceae bacterium]|nr:hypothetical protein [Thermoguttaceae bacterium]
MPTSLFQYEMLPTTWFYMSSLLILAVFFRFNRLFSIRNLDVIFLLSTTPGLVYIAMGSALQGYLWLYVIGAALFFRLAFDVFLRRRPMLAPNLNFAGLVFSCVASSAFMIPNLFLNRGDACESPRAWRLEQILSAAEDADPEIGDVTLQPGYRPFLRATQEANRFFAPSQTSWRRAATSAHMRKRDFQDVEFFGVTIRVNHTSRDSKRPAANAMRWASGASEEYSYDVSLNGDSPDAGQALDAFPESLNGVRAAPSIPSAPLAPTTPEESASASPSSSEVVADAFPRKSFADDPVERVDSIESASFRWLPLSRGGLALVLTVVVLQLGVVFTIVMIGGAHFGSIQTGFAAALLYLLLPYINQFSARLDHIAPALAILLAVLYYRRPVISGIAMGIASSLVFYPFFLMPLWLGYYWRKGAARFALGASGSVLTMAALLLILIEPSDSYADALACFFGRNSLFLSEAQGLWEYLPRFYRIPIISLFGVFCFGYALWIPRKNLAALISCTAALMLATQFWMGRQGGIYMAWYLPLVVLTVFRPNLADRTAVTTVFDLPNASNT